MNGLLDTSIFIALEQGRDVGDHPTDAFVSVATNAELHLGVLMATDGVTRATRLRTMGLVQTNFVALPITQEIAGVFAEIVAPLRKVGRRVSVMDAFIAATAIAHDIPLYTQDEGFSSLTGLDLHLV